MCKLNRMSNKIQCRVHIGEKKFFKLIPSDLDVGYQAVVDFCTKKTKNKYGKEFYLEIDNEVITSKEKFISLIQSKGSISEIDIQVKDGEMPEEEGEEGKTPGDGIECLITCGEEKFEWFFEKDEDDEKNNSVNYDTFISFLSKKTGVSDVASVDIYCMDNESDATSNGDLIEACDDFGRCFDDDDDADKTVYFKVRIKSSFQVKVDLNEADCKESIIMSIPQHGFDNSKEEEWFNSWQDMTSKIGDKLNDLNWESKYSLNHSKRRESISNVSQFSSVFQNFASDDQSVNFCLKLSGSGSGLSGAKVFLIEKDGNIVSWRADGDNVTASKMWNSVLRLCRDQFGRKLKIKETPITYHPTKNVIPVNEQENGQLLTNSTIEMYWNLLKSSKESSKMYFYIGDLPKDDTKRAVIISSKLIEQKMNSQQKNCCVTMTFENEDDWEENHQQLMAFLVKLYNFKNDEIDEDDYDEHPFKIYQIEPDDLDSVLEEARSGNVNKFDTFVEEYGLDVEIEDNGTLEDFFESNEDCNKCGIYVSYKKYLKITYNNDTKEKDDAKDDNDTKVYHWVPSKYCIVEDTEEMDWNNEFCGMQKRVCQLFDLVENDTLSFVNDDECDIEEGDELKTVWEELIEDDETCYRKIVVSGLVVQEKAKKEVDKTEADKPSDRQGEKETEKEKEKEKEKETETGDDNYDDFMFCKNVVTGEGKQEEVEVKEIEKESVIERKKEKKIAIEIEIEQETEQKIVKEDKKVEEKLGELNVHEDVSVDTEAKVTEDEADELLPDRDNELLNEISVIDRLLTNVDDEATITNTIETDLEFLCDNLRKRQLFVNELSLKENVNKVNRNFNKEFINSLKIRFDNLLKLLKEEDYSDDHSIVKSIKKGKRASVTNKNFDLAAHELQTTMKNIRPFDIEGMLALFGKTIEASKQVAGKDICLVLGRTGGGKSTTIHFLAGSQMVQDPTTNHISPVNVTNEYLKEIKTDFRVTASVTRYISGVPINLRDAGVRVKIGKSSKNLVTLCDAPGFDDTSGAEVDTANGLGIVQGVSKARSAKILIILCAGDFDTRMKGIRQVAHTLAKIVPNFSGHLRCVNFMFTKMAQDTTKAVLKKNITKALDEMEKKHDDDDEVFIDILDHISQLPDDEIILLDPIKSNRKEVLSLLFKNANWIYHPGDSFEAFVTQPSMNAIKQQILLHRASIIGALNRRKHGKSTNYELVRTKINELKRLNQVLPLQSIEESLQDCIKYVSKTWNEKCEELMSVLKTSTKSRSLDEFLIDIGEYKELLNVSTECERLQKDCGFETTEEDISMTGGSLLELILEKQMEYLLDNCTLDAQCEIYFNKSRAMMNVFGDKFLSIYKLKIQELKNEISNIENETKKLINDDKNYEFNQICENFSKLGSITHLDELFGNSLNISQITHSLMEYLTKSLNSSVEVIGQTFCFRKRAKNTRVEVIRNGVLNECGLHLKRLQNAKCLFIIPKRGINPQLGKEIDELCNNTVKAIIEFCRLCANKIQKLLSNDSKHEAEASKTRDTTKQLVFQLYKIRGFDDEITLKTSQIYYQIIEYIFSYFDGIRRQFDSMIDRIEDNKIDINYDDLVKCVNVLRDCNWVFAFRNSSDASEYDYGDGDNEMLANIKVKLKNHVNKILDERDCLFVDYQEIDSLDDVKNIMTRLPELKKLETLLPNITNDINRVARVIQSNVSDTLKKIAQTYSLPKEEETKAKENTNKNQKRKNEEEEELGFRMSLNAKDAIAVLDFLSKCKTIPWINTANMNESNDNESKEKDNNSHRKPKCIKRMGRNNGTINRLVINTQTQVKEYISAFSDGTLKEMDRAFDYLRDIESPDAGVHAMSNGAKLADGLDKFYKIEKRYPKLLTYLNQDGSDKSCLKDWVKKLAKEHMTMSGNLKWLAKSKSPRLQIGVTHARAFSKSDWFLDNYGRKKRSKFSRLYTEFSKTAEPNPDCQEIIKLIDEENFMNVQTELDRLKNTIDIAKKINPAGVEALERSYRNAKRILGARLREKSSTTKMEIIKLSDESELNVEKARELGRLFDVLSDAKLYCFSYLTEKDVSLIKEIDDSAQRILQQMMGKCENVALAAIARNDFYTTEEQIKKISTVIGMLGSHWKGGDSVKIVTDDLDSRLATIRKRFIDEIQLRNQEYNPYNTPERSPKILYGKFKTVMKKNAKYQRLWVEISEDLILKFQDEMSQCRKLEFKLSQRTLIMLKQVLTSLPESISINLEVQLEQCEKYVKEKKGEQEVEKSLKANNYGKLNDIYWQYYNCGDIDSREKVKNTVKERLRNLNVEINRELTKSDVKVDTAILFSIYENVHGIVETFGVSPSTGTKSKDILVFFQSAQKNIEKKYFSVCIQIEKMVKFPIKECIDKLNDASRFIGEMCEETQRNSKLFTRNVIKNGKQLVKMVKVEFEKLNVNVNSALEHCDLTAVCSLLDLSEIFDGKESNCQIVDNLSNADPTSGIDKIAKYPDFVKSAIERGNNVKNEILNKSLSNNSKLRFEKDRKVFYKGLRSNLSLLHEFWKIETHTKMNTQKELVEPCVKHIENEVTVIKEKTDDILNDKDFKFNERTLSEIDKNYSMLRSINESKIMYSLDKQKGKDITKKYQNIGKKIDKKISDVSKNAQKHVRDNKILVPLLIELEMSRNILKSFKEKCQDELDKTLSKYRKAKPAGVALLKKYLDNHVSYWGASLANEHSIFKGEHISLFNKATSDQGIDEVLKQIGSNDNSINKDRIKKFYNKFEEMYRETVHKYLVAKIDLDPIVDNIEVIAKEARDTMVSSMHWNSHFKHCAIELLANVFAIWTLQHSKHYFEAGDASDPKSYLMQPRVAQIVSIIRLLSLDDEGLHLVRNLVEIGTGEGKSLVLACTSAVMALLGFEVSCACYSQYLSRRDYQSFEELFKLLRITDFIHYGTFNELCEQVINEDGNIREMVETIIVRTSSSVRTEKFKKENRKKILLIDEVDVFFNKEFFANTYTPVAVIKDPTIRRITDLIWNSFSSNKKKLTLTFSDIKKSKEYKKCKSKFGDWMNLIDEAIKDMMCAVAQFESTEYTVQDDKIGYKESDRINFKATLGYKTLFTYYHEHKKGNISEKSLHNKIAIYLQCGSFSYAEIPKQFHIILGVTGTLRTLCKAEQDIITKTFDIKRHTYMPSLFGVNKLKWNKERDIEIFNLINYHENLKDHIKQRMKGPAEARCVFVCFETKDKLEHFYNSKSLSSFQDDTLVLTEEVRNSERDEIIKGAAISKKILLMTRIFGRGTDFQVVDLIVKNNGGPHVVQTFLSEQESEEKQIMGRTARQGGEGSYSMVLIDKELEKYNITLDDIKEHEQKGNFYEFLDEKRREYCEKQYNENKRFVKNAQTSHRKAEELLQMLLNRNDVSARQLLIKKNRGTYIGSITKVAILMDATGSMSSLIQKTKNTVHTMFSQVGEILEDNLRDPKSFQLQFMAYKSYIAGDSILRVSGWSCDARELQRNFLSLITASSGSYGYDEAIEVALQHCNRLIEEQGDKISCVIIIGDAPPTTTKAKVMSRRKSAGSYFGLTTGYDWTKHKYCQNATYYKDEIEKLKNNNVEVHTFYMNQRAKDSFEWMAENGGGNGTCQELDVDAPHGAQTLTDLVSTKIVSSCGGEKLVRQYEHKFMHVA